jgi:glycosyltransferase involved in cell wall biosynthesis
VYLFQTAILPLTFSPPSVIIIQDFPYLYLNPRSFSMRVLWYIVRLYHHFSILKADALIAVSESTKRDLIQFFGARSEKITRVYMGFKSICAVPESSISLPTHFFYYSGVIKERKNVLASIQAYVKCLKEHPSLKENFVLAGRSGGNYYEEIVRYIHTEGIESRVFFVGHLSDAEQSYAYARATALIFPSIVESFGFPVLEAMDCGTPVITSNFGGPSETGANGAAALINPRNPESIAEAMIRVSTDEQWRTELIERGRMRAKDFSWEKTARESLMVLERVAKKRI